MRIMLRDTNSYKFAEQLNPSSPTLVLDPTLIYPLKKEIKDVNLERHIFFYSDVLLPDDRTLTELKIISKEKGLKIVSIGKHFDWADINVVSPSPFRWMGYLKNVDFVFTCMYHGLLFSIKFNRQFAMFLIPERENKCLDFLERTGLETRIVQNPSQIRTLYYTIIDYSPVNIFMQDQKEISAAFLNEENLGRISIAKD